MGGREEKTELRVNDKDSLERCYDTILHIIRFRTDKNGHFYGALYNQALAAYFCASGNGLNTTYTAQTVKEIGNVIVNVYEESRYNYPQLKREIPERIWEVYMKGGTSNVWGGEANDPVFQCFY